MVEEEFDIQVEDEEGNIILDETRQTEQNGFIDLWLPRGKTFHVKIMQEEKEVEAEISTFDTDPTCITTMQLS